MLKGRKIYIIFFIILIKSVSVYAQTNMLVPYRVKSLWGYSDYSGNLMISPMYDSVTFFTNYSVDGSVYKIAIIYKNGKRGIINEQGEKLFPVMYDFIDIIPAYYTGADAIIVKKNGKFGVLNYKGKSIIPLSYDTITLQGFSNYYFLVKRKGICYKINEDLTIHRISDSMYKNEVGISAMVGVPMEENENKYKYIFKNKDNIVKKNSSLIDSIGTTTYGNNQEYVNVYCLGKVGICSQEELLKDKIQQIIMPVYDSVLKKCYGYISLNDEPMLAIVAFLVRAQGKITVVDTKGKELMPLRYSDYVENSFNSEYILIKENNKIGFYSFEENFEIPPQYDFIEYNWFSSGSLWKVGRDGKVWYVNKEGFKYFQD